MRNIVIIQNGAKNGTVFFKKFLQNHKNCANYFRCTDVKTAGARFFTHTERMHLPD